MSLIKFSRLVLSVRMFPQKKVEDLRGRMAGAYLGRGIGYTLCVPVENMSILGMLAISLETGITFPPLDY